MVERAVILADGDSLSAADLHLGPRSAAGSSPSIPVMRIADGTGPVPTLPAQISDSELSLDLRSALEGLERRMIHEALARAQGNRTEAAALLGLNRTTLVEKLRKYAA